MNCFNLEEVKEFSSTSHVKKVICEYANTKALLICFEAKQSVPACTMESDVFFYTVEGCGLLHMGEDSVEIKTGVLIMVPAGIERQIEALSRLSVLAIQVHKIIHSLRFWNLAPLMVPSEMWNPTE